MLLIILSVGGERDGAWTVGAVQSQGAPGSLPRRGETSDAHVYLAAGFNELHLTRGLKCNDNNFLPLAKIHYI